MLRRNILIFHSGALGDFILTWPLAVAMGRIHPQNRIIYVTSREKGQLAEKVARVDFEDVENGWHFLYADDASPTERAGKFLTGAHTIIGFIASPIWSTNIQRLAPQAKLVTLQAKPLVDFTQHASEWLLQQLIGHPVERAAMEQILRSINQRGIGFHRTPGNDVVIHPGSGAAEKCWPIENYFQLAKQLREKNRSVRFIIGEVEREKWPADTINNLKSFGIVRNATTYLELLNELATAAIFIGNDSGPGHLAGIIGVPTITLFQSTNPQTWRPLGSNVHTLNAPEVTNVLIAINAISE